MAADDPVTGRRFLTTSAYADDRHLRSRLSIWAYAEVPPDPGWRLAAVPWDGTQVVADVGCGNGFDLRQLVPGGRCRAAIGIDLSAGMLRGLAEVRRSGRLSLVQADAQQLLLGRAVRALPPLSFTIETGAATLAAQFSDVTLRRSEVPLSFPAAGPVVAYLSSIREPVLAYAGGQFPFDTALEEFAARVEQAIRVQGRFRATSRSGVFICR